MSDSSAALTAVVEDILSNSVGYKDKLDSMHKLIDLSVDVTVTPKDSVFDKLVDCLIVSMSAPAQTIRITALRLIKLFYKNTEFIEALLKKNAGIFISASLERSKTASNERVQALKLLQKMIIQDPLLIPRGVAQTIVSIAKQVDDPILSAAMANPALSGSVGGIHVLFHSIINMERFFESFQTSLLVVATYLLNDQPTRKYFNINEISLFVEPFTDTYESSQDTRKRKWTSGQGAIAGFLRTWTGLICLTSTPLGLKAFVQSIQLQDLYLNDITLDALFSIFHFPVTRVSEASFDRAKKIDYTDKCSTQEPGPPERHNLLDNYQAVLLTVFNEFQLLESLIGLIARMNKRSTDTGETKCIARKAILLIAELLHLSNRLLPASQCAKLQGLPKLMRDAIDFTLDPHLRSLAGTTISDLEKLALTKRTDLNDTSKVDYFDEVKKNFDANMDDSTLKQKLNESVLMKKDFSQYNWEIINELIEGPLTNPVHYQSPLVVRFIKKVLSFFRPSNKIFPNMVISGNEKYGRIACSLIDLIISHDNSVILAENQLISEIAEVLRDALPDSKGNFTDMLSSEKVLRTMTTRYFEMLGTLSKTKSGLDVLNKHKVFEYLPLLAALPSRDDICNLVIQNLDYNTPGPSRVVLAKSLNAKSQVVRYLATKRLQALMRSGVSDFTEWGVRFLVQKLSDENTRVSSFALGILEEAACNTALLDSLINKRAFDVLTGMGKPGKELLTRFLSRTVGFSYLSSTTFVENELIFWKATGYLSYVNSVESSLADAFHSSVWRKGSSSVPVPVHLYGELVQTKDGIKLLEQKGDLEDFLGLLCSDKATSLQKRGALWVLGHIGKAKLGYKELFVKYDVLRTILHIANNCTCLAVRGTCFYALGLICSTRSAARALQHLGWECKRESFICVPVSVKDCGVFTVNDSGTEPTWSKISTKFEVPKFSDARDEVIKHFMNLSCKLTFDKSLNAIKALKAQHPEVFQDHEVQFHIFRCMQHYHFQLPPRRFFNQIFDVFWTLEKINSLPPYPLVRWQEATDGFAYFPPLPTNSANNWVATVDKNRSLRRNSIRGTFGARRASVTTKEETIPKSTKSTLELTPKPTPENPPEKQSSPLLRSVSSSLPKKVAPPPPMRTPALENGPGVKSGLSRTLVPPSQTRRGSPDRGRGSPDRGRGLADRGRGIPSRGRFPQRSRGPSPGRGRGSPPVRPPRAPAPG